MKKIMIVDDDASFLEAVKDLLSDKMEVVTTTNPKEGIVLASDNYYDLIIVDYYMPELSGGFFVELISSLSPLQKSVVISGCATVEDQLKILENENVDFIDKAVAPEIFARLIERKLSTENVNSVGSGKIFSAQEEIELDTFYRTVKVRGERVSVTTKEFLLLNLFLKNKNVVLSRKEIAETVWKGEDSPSSRSIDVLIVKLRKKINTALIVTKRGVGYVWREK